VSEIINISPQAGFQEKFLSSSADVVVGGGAAGAGKTRALLMEPLRNMKVRGYSATIFRRTYPEITNPGALWDESTKIYPYCGFEPVKSSLEWHMKDKANREISKVVFRHLQYEDSLSDYQGAQLPFIGFDELTHFTRDMFLYLLSRNRSTCGVPSIVRATCNPDADSWLAEFIDWYIGEDGYIRKDRDGVIRYFTIDKDKVVWGETKGEVIEKARYKFDLIPHGNKEDLVMSFTFIEGDIHENKILLKDDPAYLAKLLSGSEEDQLRLYKKNWKIKIEKDIIFNHIKFQDVFLSDFVSGGSMYITADIATSGRDLLIIAVWCGKRWVDVEICGSNSGKEAVEKIEQMRSKWRVPNSNILFDADGVGGGMTGWIANCVEFRALHRPIGRPDYRNIKAQCYFELSYCVNQTNGKTSEDMYYVTPDVATRIFPLKDPGIYRERSIRWILEHQMKAIRKDKPDIDQKLNIIRKDEQKTLINGLSPDFMDVWMMREYFELIQIERFINL
jgi:hypothetical protein